MKFSINEAFKASLKIFRQNFFVVFSLSIFSTIVIPLFFLLLMYLTADNSFFTNVIAFANFPAPLSPYEELAAMIALGSIIQKQLPWLCVIGSVWYLAQLISLLFMGSALLSASAGRKIKFRDYFSDFKKVFNYCLGIVLLAALMGSFALVFVAIGTIIHVPAFNFAFVALPLVFVLLLRYSIFFDIEILGGSQVIESLKNSSKLVSGNLCKIILLLLLMALILLIPSGTVMLIAEALFGSYLVAKLIVAGVMCLAIALFTGPFFRLVTIHVYTQLSKSNSLGNDD